MVDSFIQMFTVLLFACILSSAGQQQGETIHLVSQALNSSSGFEFISGFELIILQDAIQAINYSSHLSGFEFIILQDPIQAK